jgi:AcrR family transcriptional regulator
VVCPPSADDGGQASNGIRGPRRRFRTPNLQEQILAATAQVVAEEGYEQATVESICAPLGIPTDLFQAHFKSKQEAVLSAVEAVVDYVMPDCQKAFVAAKSEPKGVWSWPEGVWAATKVFTDWAACEPSFACLGIVELPRAGLQGEKLTLDLIDTFALFLAPGYELLGEQSAIGSLDAEVGEQLLQTLRTQIERDSPQSLPGIAPELARIALAPFVGAAAAERFVAEKVAAERRLTDGDQPT